jgi:hypothetical protein
MSGAKATRSGNNPGKARRSDVSNKTIGGNVKIKPLEESVHRRDETIKVKFIE